MLPTETIIPPILEDYTVVAKNTRDTVMREIERLRAEWTPKTRDEARAVYAR